MLKNFAILLTTMMMSFSLSNVDGLINNSSNNQVKSATPTQEVVKNWSCPDGNRDCLNDSYHSQGYCNQKNPEITTPTNQESSVWNCPNGNVDCRDSEYHNQGHCSQKNVETTSPTNQESSVWNCPNGNVNCGDSRYHNQGHCNTNGGNQAHHRGSGHHKNNHH